LDSVDRLLGPELQYNQYDDEDANDTCHGVQQGIKASKFSFFAPFHQSVKEGL